MATNDSTDTDPQSRLLSEMGANGNAPKPPSLRVTGTDGMVIDHGFDRVPTGLDNGDLSAVEKQKKSSTLSEGQTTIHDHGDTARLSQHTGDEQSEDPDPSQSDLAGIGGAPAIGDSDSVVSRNLQLSDSDSDDAEGLWTSIDDKLIQPPPHDGKKFLPLDDLKRSIARPQVRRALIKLSAFSEDEAHEYANHVCDTTQVANTQRTTRQRMFATLVLIEHVEALRSLVEEKLHDIHLPFKLQREKAGKKWLLFYKAADGELVQFQGSSTWRNSKVKSFYDKQWLVLSPFFDMKASKPLFYPLEPMVILPFVEGSEGQSNTAFGGFGTVWRVKIHHAHHNYDNRSDPAFAIKKLHSNNKEEFDRELLALKKFNRREHPNLMKLLATYQHHEHRFFVFPWADGNLREFWQRYQTPQRTHNLVVWMADQVCGIASGLQLIQHPPKDDALTVQDFRNYGRHGDLKPENVLWFRNDSQEEKCFPGGGLLKIADFGLTRYHHDLSKSDVNARGLGVSLTYKAPEYDVRSSVSQAYDIWTLGLLLLEFVTWYLEGWDGVDQFSKNRAEEDDQNEIPLDTFYNLVYNQDAIAGAELKTSVREWIQGLHRHEDCSLFLHGLLTYISHHMLRISPNEREKCDAVVSKLQEMARSCKSNSRYATQGCAKPPNKTDTTRTDNTVSDDGPDMSIPPSPGSSRHPSPELCPRRTENPGNDFVGVDDFPDRDLDATLGIGYDGIPHGAQSMGIMGPPPSFAPDDIYMGGQTQNHSTMPSQQCIETPMGSFHSSTTEASQASASNGYGGLSSKRSIDSIGQDTPGEIRKKPKLQWEESQDTVYGSEPSQQ